VDKLGVMSFITDRDGYGGDGLWRLSIWKRALKQLDLPGNTSLVVVDNTASGLPDDALGDIAMPVTLVPLLDAVLTDENRAIYFNILWSAGLSGLTDQTHLLALDTDVIPQTTYAEMRAELDRRQEAGAVALKVRTRRGPGHPRTPSRFRENGYMLSAWKLNSLEPYSYGPEPIEPTEAVTIGKTNGCCVLFRREAIDHYRPRSFVSGPPLVTDRFENALWYGIWAKDWEVWLLGNLPWCRHYLDPTHYVADEPVVLEDTDE